MTSLLRPAAAGLFAAALLAPAARGQAVVEGFDDVSALPAAGWSFVQRTPSPDPGGTWRQGGDTHGGAASAAFTPRSGAAGSYIRSDYTQTTATASVTVSDWLILPTRTLNNGDTISFSTRTTATGRDSFPERLVVRLSANGASTDVGSTATSVGDFGTVLGEINPGQLAGVYPDTWTRYSFTVSGLAEPTAGRLALHHFLLTSGPFGEYGDQIGVDDLVLTPVPEPAGLLLAAGFGLAVRRFHRRSLDRAT